MCLYIGSMNISFKCIAVDYLRVDLVVESLCDPSYL